MQHRSGDTSPNTKSKIAMRRILIFILLAVTATASARIHSKVGKSLERHDSLIAYWDFSTKEHSLKAKGCVEELVLRAKSEDVKPEFVDEGKIGLRPAVEISYLQEEEQRDLVDFIDTEGVFPSHAQTIRMKELSREGKLDTDTINAIMSEDKPNQKEKIKIPMERLDRFFQKGTSSKQIEDTIIKALTFYRQRKRDNRDDR